MIIPPAIALSIRLPPVGFVQKSVTTPERLRRSNAPAPVSAFTAPLAETLSLPPSLIRRRDCSPFVLIIAGH